MSSAKTSHGDSEIFLALQAMDSAYLRDEETHVRELMGYLTNLAVDFHAVKHEAVTLVRKVRARSRDVAAMEAFMREYDLSSEEGVILMCLAEALLRIPDNDTAEALIADKLSEAHWEAHVGKSESVFVNASTWGLMLTGKVVRLREPRTSDLSGVIGRLVARSGEPVIRLAIRQAMKIMGHQYVMGRNIKEALTRASKPANRKFRYSFDMLGEAALTAEDAARYKEAYRQAIEYLGTHREAREDRHHIYSAPSISVKLSALHPRYHPDQSDRVIKELTPIVLELACLARQYDVALTMDAEEADRLDQSLAIFAGVLADKALAGWDGFGLAVQAYQKRAWFAIDYLRAVARETSHRIPIRLVKGAYWDTEIKFAQVEGLPGYPVFTRKAATDLSYLACAHKLINAPEAFYPQFATHNAHTISAIEAFADNASEFEYQRLHGMGVELYDQVLESHGPDAACRVYAPVGEHKDLLPYLVRRLLENGANTSFVNRVVDEDIDPMDVVSDPIEELGAVVSIPHPKIPQPTAIFGHHRKNSEGLNFGSVSVKHDIQSALKASSALRWEGGYRGSLSLKPGDAHPVVTPYDLGKTIGQVMWVAPSDVSQIMACAVTSQARWDALGAGPRADILDAVADQLSAQTHELMALCLHEAGKSVRDAIAEIREAIDFCRYYAAQAREGMTEPLQMPGPTGESNHLSYRGRGVFVCISPWNFPLAIFVGQVVAALVTGNAVIAKPAEQTSLMASRAVELMYAAGVPRDVLHLVPGDAVIGHELTSHPEVSGVAFTGSTETAKVIARTLIDREASLATMIAETGGQNAMIVDSSALPEQVVRDVISSAFLSAGQRCSALRVLCLQTDIADGLIKMLSGAMRELTLGIPDELSIDIGPIIDQQQHTLLEAHVAKLNQHARLVGQVPMPCDLPEGHWFAPCAYEIDSLNFLEREVFGPILHIVRYKSRDLDQLIDQINRTGYGLTLGVHSRIDRVQQHVAHRAQVGNCYVNRNMTGAVVGVQPFGGEGLSGTGPKAGGPHYLYRFCTERVLTVNTSAVGGNASLIALSDD